MRSSLSGTIANLAGAAAMWMAMTAPALAQSDDCAELKAVVAAAVGIAPGAPLAPDTTLPLLDGTCNNIQHGMPTCTWTFTTGKTGRVSADLLDVALTAKVSVCFPGSETTDNPLAENTRPDADEGTITKLPTGQTIEVNDHKSSGSIVLTVTPAP